MHTHTHTRKQLDRQPCTQTHKHEGCAFAATGPPQHPCAHMHACPHTRMPTHTHTQAAWRALTLFQDTSSRSTSTVAFGGTAPSLPKAPYASAKQRHEVQREALW